jgi:hypothetical protein
MTLGNARQCANQVTCWIWREMTGFCQESDLEAFSHGATVFLGSFRSLAGIFRFGVSLHPFCQRLAVVARARNLGQIVGRPAVLPSLLGATHRATKRSGL